MRNVVVVPLIVVVSLGVAYTIAKRSASTQRIIKQALMDPKRINVLVYSGAGTSELSKAQTFNSLKIHLGSNYAVQPVTANQLKNEPWEETTALLVIPGGADLPYVRDLQGDGTARIRKFVESGGRYLGLCAGGYFGASEIQFEKGTPIEVCGPRDLKFFPGVAQGCTYPGFDYESFRGCRATTLNFKDKPLSASVYYNGGCHFELQPGSNVEGIDEIAKYADNGKVAIVGCKVGNGKVVLCGVHPEYAPSAFNSSDPYAAAMLPALLLGETQRTEAFRSLLSYLSLSLDESPTTVAPPLSDVFLVAQGGEYDKILSSLSSLSTPFSSVAPGKGHALKFEINERKSEVQDRSEVLPVVVCKKATVEESGFDSDLFFKHLSTRYIGKLLMCAHTVTSTQTIMMDHFMTMKDYPGLVFTAITQVSGRGRGSNVWVSPYGTMATSFQLPAMNFSSVLFIEYILAISIVHVIKTITGHEDLDINIKWPNDIYYNKTRKIAGILISSNLDMDNSSLFHPVVGFGLNLWNTKPTTCVNDIIREYNEKHGTKIEFIAREELLAKILSQFEEHFAMFTNRGFKSLEHLYYKYWMHSKQQVIIEADGTAVTIQGLTKEGYLLATAEDGRQYELHPDQNSFDLMHGLIKKKT